MNTRRAGLLVERQPSRAAYYSRRAVDLRPDFVEAHFNLAITLSRPGRVAEAAKQDRTVLCLRPGFVPARDNLRALYPTSTFPP